MTVFRFFSYQVATQLSSEGWVDPVPDHILPQKFLEYSWESNLGPFGWQSGVLTTIPTGGRFLIKRFLENHGFSLIQSLPYLSVMDFAEISNLGKKRAITAKTISLGHVQLKP